MRLGILLRKWSSAIAKTYADEITKPDEEMWGFLFEVLFTFAGGLIGRVVARTVGDKIFAHFAKKADKLKTIDIEYAEAVYESTNSGAKYVEEQFNRVEEALVEGGKLWEAQEAKRSTRLSDNDKILASMSDTVGQWAQDLRRQFIFSAANKKGDAARSLHLKLLMRKIIRRRSTSGKLPEHGVVTTIR